jgi:hypothetical protein
METQTDKLLAPTYSQYLLMRHEVQILDVNTGGVSLVFVMFADTPEFRMNMYQESLIVV